MTEQPEPVIPKDELGFKVFKGRRLAPLIGPWISSAIFAGLAYYAERTIPALHDVAVLVYLLLLAIVAIATMRWLRVRGKDRRGGNRRMKSRPET